jgi:hypothetical protein
MSKKTIPRDISQAVGNTFPIFGKFFLGMVGEEKWRKSGETSIKEEAGEGLDTAVDEHKGVLFHQEARFRSLTEYRTSYRLGERD